MRATSGGRPINFYAKNQMCPCPGKSVAPPRPLYIYLYLQKRVNRITNGISEEKRGASELEEDDGGGEMSVPDRFYKGVDRLRRPRASVAAGALSCVCSHGVATRPTVVLPRFMCL